MRAPACGLPDDRQVHHPPDWISFVPPAKGQSYIDPVFGCTVTRLTDSNKDGSLSDGMHAGFMHYYSTFSPVNAGDTMLLITSTDGSWQAIDGNGTVVVHVDRMPAMNNGHPVWDAADGSVFYYTLAKSLHKARIVGHLVKTEALHTFEEYRGIVSPDAADLSQDGDHIALVGQNSNDTIDVFVWSLARQTKTSVYTTTCKIHEWAVTQSPQPGCIHKLQLTPDNLLVIAFVHDGAGSEQGARLWDGHELRHLQDRTNHLHTRYVLKGDPIFIS